MHWKEVILPLLPKRAADTLRLLNDDVNLTEIRLRAGMPMQLLISGESRLIYDLHGKPMLGYNECEGLLSAICGRSVYAWEEELRQGFITLEGGYRVGVAGRVIRDRDEIERICKITSFCFRIVREHRDVCVPLLPMISEDGRLLSTLIASPPGCGKTIMLRDLIRKASNGEDGLNPVKVAVADERFELSGSSQGREGFDLGVRTDVMSGILKSSGMTRLVCTMSPEVIAVDELSRDEDAEAVLDAFSCGVIVLATAHAKGLKELLLRPAMRRLYEAAVFKRYVLLCGIGQIAEVRDEGMSALGQAQ